MSISVSKAPCIGREFLGWAPPALPEAARRLTARYCSAHGLDLGRVIVVVPGERAGRRLQELLAFAAEDAGLGLTPPRVVTQGRLPECLYTPKRPFANDVVQDLVWAQALRDLPDETRRYIVPHPPPATDALPWLELGKLLRRLHVELAADGLDFAGVLTRASKLVSSTESERWQALAKVQRRYLRLLDDLALWDFQTARLKAIGLGEIVTACDIILLGTVDLNNTLRRMLDQVAGRVTAYIVAPQNLANRFDAHGCVLPGAWRDALLPLQDEQLSQVDGPVDEAEAVACWLFDLNQRFRVDQVTIGVPDVSLVPQLQRQLEQHGVRGRWVEGIRLRETSPYRLLEAAVRFASGRRYDDLAALVRHPDVEKWLRPGMAKRRRKMAAMSLPAQLDRFYNTHLPSRIHGGPAVDNAEEWPDLTSVVERVDQWLDEALGSKPLRLWGNVFRKALEQIYRGRTLQLDKPRDDVLHRALRSILAECERLEALPAALDTPILSALDAFRIAVAAVADQALPPPADPEAVEILGWLELPLDDAAALIVTSFNEGFVPQSTGADAFLPDRLRRELGLVHNDRRYARDAYATSVICQSGKELRILCARRDADNNPLQPSRLAFACDNDTLIRRARAFFKEQKAPMARCRSPWAALAMVPEKSQFYLPAPVKPKEKLQRIRVTSFKAYLACPYRYYLRHVEKLRAVDDSARELDGSAFGSLLHAVLSALGRDPAAPRQSAKEHEIFQFLDHRLQALAGDRYGTVLRRAAVRLQLEQARQRLKAFACRQAALARDGWRIIHAEDADDADRTLSVPFARNGEPVELVGRIDRIDFHERTRRVRILDYKTADSAEAPDKTHRKGETWIDLQLPLYRHLWRKALVNGPSDCAVELGYFNLPKDLENTGVVLADWDSQLLEDADAQARKVMQNIQNGVFGPPVYDPVPPFCEDLAAICLDNVYGRPPVDEADEGGAI
jgi:hypothetical protein